MRSCGYPNNYPCDHPIVDGTPPDLRTMSEWEERALRAPRDQYEIMMRQVEQYRRIYERGKPMPDYTQQYYQEIRPGRPARLMYEPSEPMMLRKDMDELMKFNWPVPKVAPMPPPVVGRAGCPFEAIKRADGEKVLMEMLGKEPDTVQAPAVVQEQVHIEEARPCDVQQKSF